MKGSGKDALNGNIRLTYRVDRLSFSNNTNLNYNTSDTEPVAFRNFVNANPYYSKYNENGEITKYFERTATLSGYEYAYNPLWDFNQKSYNRTNTFSLNNNFQVEWRILEELRLRSMSVSSPNLEESFSHGGSTEAPFVKVLELLWKRQEQVNRELAELDAKREEIKGVIEQLENKDERMLLLYRYVQGMKWEDIASELGWTERNVFYVHGKALRLIKTPT